VLLALLGVYPFLHFTMLLAPHGRREELVRVHNTMVRSLGDALDCDTSSLKVHSPRDAARFLQTYAAVILSFMSAVHWGAVTARAVKGAGLLPQLASVVPAVAAWAALNTSPDVNPPVYGRDEGPRDGVIPAAARPYLSEEASDLRFPSAASVLAGGFLWVFAQDVAAVVGGRLPPWYATYRLLLTLVVTSCLKLADVGLEGGPLPPALVAVTDAMEEAARGAGEEGGRKGEDDGGDRR